MFGYRPDGKKIKNIDPIQRIMPHIMKHRHDSQNLTQYDCPCEPIDDFIRREAEKGDVYNYMHIVIASLVRLIALFPRINRFIMNGRIYKRNCIQISFVTESVVIDTTESCVFCIMLLYESDSSDCVSV